LAASAWRGVDPIPRAETLCVLSREIYALSNKE
jgi:hypothetical protein